MSDPLPPDGRPDGAHAGVATDPPARVAAMDALRGFAVCGIVLLNIYNFAMPPAAYFNPLAYGGDGPSALAIWALESVFAQDAFRAVFAMLFGAGITILWDRAGHARFAAHAARMIVLLAIGVLHALLLANGDVLRLYAIVGLFLPLFLGLSQRGVLSTIAVLAALHIVGLGAVFGGLLIEPQTGVPPAPGSLAWVLEAEFGVVAEVREWGLAMGQQGLVERVIHRAGLWRDQLAILALFAPQTLAAMLIGVWAWRSGLLQGAWPRPRCHALAATCAVVALPPLALLCWAAFASGFSGVVVGSTALVWSQPFAIVLGVGYAAVLFARWGDVPLTTGLGAWLAAAGRLSLTNYIGASILAAAIYAPWGLGLFGTTDRVETTLVACGITAVILLASPVWSRRFGTGPFERLWRGMAARLVAPQPRS